MVRLEGAINPSRVRFLTKTKLAAKKAASSSGGAVVYWMSRDQRAVDNWALIKAREIAAEHGATCHVVFNLVPSFLGATRRHYAFMLDGLRIVEQQLQALRIPFHLLRGDPKNTVPQFAADHKAIAVVTDMSPLRVARKWHEEVAGILDTQSRPMIQVQEREERKEKEEICSCLFVVLEHSKENAVERGARARARERARGGKERSMTTEEESKKGRA